MNNWKTVVGVIGGSLLVLLLVSFGLSKLSTDSTQITKVEGTEGKSRLILGNKEGSVTITEFSDFQCPACYSAQPTVDAVLSKYPEVRLIYREFPLVDIHPNANPAALAAEAANAQGKFGEFHHWLFANRDWVGKNDPTEDFVKAAGELGMDKVKFEADLKNKTFQNFVDEDISYAVKIGVNSTPTFFVNGIKASTADLDATVKQAIGK